MFKITKEQALRLAAKGIAYCVPSIVTFGSDGTETEAIPIDDTEGKSETDILLDRLRVIPPGDYVFPPSTYRQMPDPEQAADPISDWMVDKDGNLVNKEKAYEIPRDRLTEDDWIIHMMEKGWVNMNSFMPAYLEALKRAGHRSVRIKTEY
jgi:hypothetical protein